MNILVTGSAGFIGANLVKRLFKEMHDGLIVGIDNPDVYIESNIIGFYNIPSTGLRFFTVYGPAGRPDMAYFGFTPKITLREGLRKFAEWYKEYYE